MNDFQNKKGVLIFLTILVVAGVYFLFSYIKKPSANNSNLQKGNLSLLNNEAQTKDDDNDGLKNWEEILWKTDPSKSDTDEDGTTDGEEIKQNRNPLVKGPEDKLSHFPREEITPNADGSGTLTDAMGQQVLNEILLNKKISDTLSPEDASSISESMISAIDQASQSIIITKYTIADIKIFIPSKDSQIKDYGNTLGAISKKYLGPLPQSELIIYQEALINQDKEKIKELEAIALAYENISKDALQMQVPKEFASDHLSLINSCEQISKELKNMQKALIDPALGLVSFKQYLDTAQNVFDALTNINSRFEIKGIIFNEQEPGNIFKLYQSENKNVF